VQVLVSQLCFLARADAAHVDVRVPVESIENGGRTTRCCTSRELLDAPADETPLAVELRLVPTDIEGPQEPESFDRVCGDSRMTDC